MQSDWLKCFYSLFEPSPGDAVAIAATAVIWTCIMGFIFLREKLHWVDFAMIPGGFLKRDC